MTSSRAWPGRKPPPVMARLLADQPLITGQRIIDTLFPIAAVGLGAVYAVLILALVMALVGFVLIYLVSAIYYRLRYKIMLKPF